MVSYFNPATMYRHHQQTVANSSATQFHHANPTGMMHPWYAAGYHPGPQLNATAAPPGTYCLQEDPQIWHHSPSHSVFQNEFPPDFIHGIPPLQQTHQVENQIPSPPMTVSGSEMSSPGGGHISPPNSMQNGRPPPARSPFDWMRKTSYTTQPTPGKTRTKDKYRVVYTDHQRVELEKEFYYSRYITIRRKSELASNLGLSERQVKIWFQNRRAKDRKQIKKRDEITRKDGSELVQLTDLPQTHHHQMIQQNSIISNQLI